MKRIRFWNYFFNNAIDFQSRFPKRVRLLANFTQLKRLLIESFTECQVLKWKLYDPSAFEVKIIFEKQNLMKTFRSKNHFWIFKHRRKAKVCSYALSPKPTIGEKRWRKNRFLIKSFQRDQILRQVFHNGSRFESRFWKRVVFSPNFKKLGNFWNGILKACQTFNHIFLP